MSAITWEIEYAGDRKTAAEWGVSGLSRVLANQQADVLSFQMAEEVDSEPTFAHDGVIVVYRDGVRWFMGSVKSPESDESGSAAVRQYEVHGPWLWLEETTYRQPWIQQAGLPTSHIVLNNGTSLRDQILLVLSWAIARGAPIAVGTIGLDQRIIGSEFMDQMCSEVIRNQLKWAPDAVTWFDYTQNPPVLHIQRSADLPVVDIELEDEELAKVKLKPRHDLVVPSVVINYEYTHEEDGRRKMGVTAELAPEGASGMERRALVTTFDLQGSSVTRSYASIYTNPNNCTAGGSPTDATRLAWWRGKFPRFDRTSEYRNLQITEVSQNTVPDEDDDTPPVPLDLPNEVVDSQWPYWMETQLGYIARKIKITCTATCDLYNDQGKPVEYAKKIPLSVVVLCTDAESGEYDSVESVDEGESPAIFAGLAQWLYESHSVLHHDGTIRMAGRDVLSTIRPGMRLNLPGGSGRLAAIAAMVQQVTEDVASGTTDITLGAPNHLGVTDVVEWLRAFRNRKRWTRPDAQSDAEYKGSSQVDTGGRNGSVGGDAASDLRARTLLWDGAGVGCIDLDPSACLSKVLKPREITVCDGNVEKKMVVLASDLYL